MAAIFACLSLSASAQRAEYGKPTGDVLTHIIVRFKPGFKPVPTRRHQMLSFGLPTLDELNFKYKALDAKRLGSKFDHNPAWTYLLRFRGAIDVAEATREYKATNYFELVMVTDRRK